MGDMKPTVISNELVSVCYEMPDSAIPLSVQKAHHARLGSLSHLMGSILAAAIVEPRLLNLLERTMRTSAAMIQDEIVNIRSTE